MKPRSPLRSSVRRVLALALPARRPRSCSFLLLAAVGFFSLGSGVAAAAAPVFRQEHLAGLSSFDVGDTGSPEFVDLDGDGDLDLVAGSFSAGLRYFRNDGNSVSPIFREQVGAANPFRLVPVVTLVNPELADLDGDGDRDLVLGGYDGLLRYFRNTGSAGAPAFAEQTSTGNPFLGLSAAEGASSPELADLDGDGDLDAVVGEQGGRFFYYRNSGSASAPAFVAVGGAANPFAGIDIGTYSTPQLADIDADGDLDLIAGLQLGTISYFVNSGSASAPAFTELTGSANPFAVLPGFPAITSVVPVFADLDGDGRRDLVVGESFGSFLHFRNTGSASAPAFVKAGDSPLGGTELAPGGSAALADLDHDGDLDAITGDEDELRYFRNTGGPRQAAFRELTGSGSPISGSFSGSDFRPALADLDADGDLDLLVANFQGALRYRINTGSSAAPAFVSAPASADPFAALTLGSGFNRPAFGDLDGDGDDDLLIGSGAVAYFENTGQPGIPAFVARTGAANPFAAFSFTSGASPDLVDYDRDGDLDMVAGQQPGDLRYFRNAGTEFSASFTELTGSANPFAGIDVGSMSVPAARDLDGDGDLDLLVADFGGWVTYLREVTADLFADGFESGDARNWQVVP